LIVELFRKPSYQNIARVMIVNALALVSNTPVHQLHRVIDEADRPGSNRMSFPSLFAALSALAIVDIPTKKLPAKPGRSSWFKDAGSDSARQSGPVGISFPLCRIAL
jgi:hypothetical protein